MPLVEGWKEGVREAVLQDPLIRTADPETRSEYLSWVEKFCGYLLNDPCWDRYSQKCLRHSPDPNSEDSLVIRSASDVLGERCTQLCDVALKPSTFVSSAYVDGTDIRERIRETAIYLSNLAIATPFLWPSNMRLALRGTKVPRHRIDTTAIGEAGQWHTFDRDADLSISGYEDMGVQGFSILSAPGRWLSYFIHLSFNGHFSLVLIGGSNHGEWFPDAIPPQYRDMVGSILSAVSFSHSECITREPEVPGPGIRKRRRKSGIASNRDRVFFIRLRRKYADKATSEPSSGGREWSRRWLVSGHHRAQWYPSKKAHRLIWIAPHIKGPEDKPFVESRAVYKVER